jgi:NAD(P)-dependent dehydrogenase (short-subunit alcohol dehydrogenase family)
MRLEGRVAIVTGAASGIGEASAQLFASEGANVLAVDLPGKNLAKAHHDHRQSRSSKKAFVTPTQPT